MADGLKSEAATVNEDEEYGSRLSGYGGQARTACDTIRFKYTPDRESICQL